MYGTRGWSRCAIVTLASWLSGTSMLEAQVNRPTIPVEVINPHTNPAVTSDIDNPGRAPYQSVSDQSGQCSGNACSFPFAAAPSGHRIVVQHVSGVVDVLTPPTQALVSVALSPFAPGGFLSVTGFTAPTVMLSVQEQVFDGNVLFYVDPGQSVTVGVFLPGGTYLEPAGQNVVLTGYVVDCTVANCAPIAH
jgi:hypothetical protein